MKIRAGVRAYRGSLPARHRDEAEQGLNLVWVELDGHRFENVIALDTRLDAGFQVVQLELAGMLEVVWLDEELEELPREPEAAEARRAELVKKAEDRAREAKRQSQSPKDL